MAYVELVDRPVRDDLAAEGLIPIIDVPAPAPAAANSTILQPEFSFPLLQGKSVEQGVHGRSRLGVAQCRESLFGYFSRIRRSRSSNPTVSLPISVSSEFAAKDLIDLLRVRLPARHFHDLSDEEPEDPSPSLSGIVRPVPDELRQPRRRALRRSRCRRFARDFARRSRSPDRLRGARPHRIPLSPSCPTGCHRRCGR